jgi:hypothetical protein
MKHLKGLVLAEFAASLVSTAALPASTRATELYQGTESGVAAVKAGTQVRASLVETEQILTTEGIPFETCTGGELIGKVAGTGSSTTTASISLESVTWLGWAEPTHTNNQRRTRSSSRYGHYRRHSHREENALKPDHHSVRLCL